MEIGRKNISFGWLWILVGIIVGSIISLWCFNGPLASPFGDYTSLSRRMIRLSHIAFIALAIINILYGYQIDNINSKEKLKRLGSNSMIYGAVLMPVLLIAAAFFEPIKYVTVLPAALVIVALMIIVTGMKRSQESIQ